MRHGRTEVSGRGAPPPLPAARTGCGTAPRSGRPAASSSSWVPRSTIRPSSTTRIRSAARTVESRWAITTAVRPCQRLGQGLLHGRLRGGVEVGGRLVEDDDPLAGQQQPGDGQPLPFAAGEAVAAFADDRVQAVGQRGDQAVEAGRGAGRPTCRPRSASGRASSRLARTESWKRWPSWVTMPSVSRSESGGQVAYVDAAEPYGARVGVVQPGQQLRDGRLARRRRSRPARPSGRVRRGRRCRAGPRGRRGCRGWRPPPGRRGRPCRRTGSRSGRRRTRRTPGRPAPGGRPASPRSAASGRGSRRPARS